MKLKIPPVVIFFLGIGCIFGAHHFWPEYSYQFAYQTLLSRLFLAVGVLIAFSGIITFRMKGTTVDPLHPDKASALVTSGVYRYTRNPMYLGMALVILGGIVRIGNPIGILGVVFFIWYIDRFQILPEEESLTKIFGEEYRQFCEQVRRWV
ncbi:methyltransferase family protein [Ekhidna sp.]|uniref:methyltransferase family protein n=1 Tax=Ekhidna sp. TaxID=2608089 RepID=UPI003B50BB21